MKHGCDAGRYHSECESLFPFPGNCILPLFLELWKCLPGEDPWQMQLYGNLKVNLSGFPEEECILIPTSQSITYSEEIEDRTEKEDVKYQ